MQTVETPEPLRPAPPADAPLPPSVPPPPPAFDPLPTRMQLQVLGAMFGTGVVLAAIGAFGSFRYDIHVELGGLFLGTYASLVALSWLPHNVFTRRIDKLLDRWVRNSATGYYGVMALSAFVSLEARNVIDSLSGFELDVQKMLMHRLMGFSIESMKNLGLAFGWPALALKNGQSVAALVLVAATWSVFHATSRVLPHATFRKRKEKKAKKKKKQRD